ncbi:MAG: hypothetical protein NVSMB9_33570 [Isosphaeraceae bacterium]
MLVASKFGLLLAALLTGAGFDSASLDREMARVLPRASEEVWLQVPWRTDFAAARVEANRVGKPLFLWMMDGHPLGCT